MTALGTAPLSFQWLQNGTNLDNVGNVSGVQTPTLTLANVAGNNAGTYQAIVSNSWGSVTSQVATLTVIDPFITANPVTQAVQAGQAVVFGVTTAGAQPIHYQWSRNSAPLSGATNAALPLINAQGTDAGYYDVVVSTAFGSTTSTVAMLTVNVATPDAFNPGAASVTALAVQPDGKVLVGTSAAAKLVPTPVRFNPDDTLDPGFSPGILSGAVSSLVVQPDDKILAAGSAESRQRILSIWRLNADGLADTVFTNNLNPNISGTINSLALRPDGKILAGGGFTISKPTVWTNLARFDSDGTLDTNFIAGANSIIYSLAVQPDGAILVGGSFTTLSGHAHTRLGRFNADGTLDTNFNATANSTVQCLVVQPDGKVLVGGSFTTLDGQSIHPLGRLNRDGTLDSTFNPNANGIVYSLALQADGKVLVAGTFTTLGGVARTNIGRLINTDPATQSLTSDSSSITWLRGGTSPEAWLATFETSTNGVDWTSLGAGQRVPGGWQLTGIALPPIRNLRARGFVTGGEFNGSAWFAESILGAPVVVSQPASRTNNAGTAATFFAAAGGTAPLSYQWLKGGNPLLDSGNISGSATPTLTLSNLLGGDAGAYSVIISNSSGSVTSLVASLRVVEPIIAAQPTNQLADAGQTVTFNVSASGTALIYQWRKDGTNIPGAGADTLTFTNVQRTSIGGYSVVVTSAFGIVTSSGATLTVNLAVADSFNPGANDQIRALAVQTDGKILVGGNFVGLDGQNVVELGRLNSDGTLDTAFRASASASVDCVTIQPDGKILVGGWFATLAGQSQSCIGRLNPDGSFDAAFRPGITSSSLPPLVNSLVVQPDGKILVGGWFTTLAGAGNTYIGRLNPDGTADGFGGLANNQVIAVALQPDNKILIGGWFTWLNGHTINYLARLSADGTVNLSFNPGANSYVYCIAVQPDGKILVAGNFTTLAGVTRNYIGRLNSDGSLDTAFNPGANGVINSLALQADGKIIVWGGFSTLAGQARSNLGRLNPNGTLDTTFFPTANSTVLALAPQADGKVLVGGGFSTVSGQPRSCIARLTATDAATQFLSSDGQSITWLRGGTSPEVSRATFETSAYDANWAGLGTGVRVSGGWRLNDLSLSINSSVRARGYVTGGYWTGSGWYVESIAQVLAPPSILANDGVFGLHSSQICFNTRAVPGQVVVIEATTDFVHWTQLQTNLVNTSDASGVFFTDPQSGLLN